MLIAPLPAQASEVLRGVASVIDGDSLEIRGVVIRLHGIDAPEVRQRCLDANWRAYWCGQHAALALADRIGWLIVECRGSNWDRFGRLIAVCTQDGTDLNGWLVSRGHALAYRHFSTDYVAEEDSARAAGRGLWQGTFRAPWDWRRDQ